MNELRWILLALGVLFCVGLWWWESRRGRQATDANADLRASDPFANLNAIAREVPRRQEPEVPVLERDPLRTEAHDLADEKLRIQEEPDIPPRSRFAPGPSADDRDGRIEPTVGPAETDPPPAAPPEEQSAVADDKIVTVRVSSPPLERFEGSALVRALGEVGLEHGRFSIFHRVGANGETLFSVASLVEPGTFDLLDVEGKRFPGVSFFAVLRRPADALEVFDEMLNSAREFAHQMHGTLQDERGVPLSLQRVATLRDDVTTWQKAALRSRAS